MDIPEYKRLYGGRDDAAPGWDAINARLREVYGEQQPRHWGSIIKHMLGGPTIANEAHLSWRLAMKMAELILLVTAATLPLASASPQDGVNPPAKEQVTTSTQKIKELQKQRLTTLKHQVDQLTLLVKSGYDYFGDAMEARLLLLQAELDAAGKEADRIALYKNAIDSLTQYEVWAKKSVQAGRATPATAVKIQAGRLELEKAILLAPQGGVNSLANKQVEASAQKIKELRKERIAAMKELVDQVVNQFHNAKANYENVLEAQILLLQAELDAAEKGADRIALYKKAIDSLKQREKLAVSMMELGRGNEPSILGIRARRLGVEIQLEQAKIKEAKEGK